MLRYHAHLLPKWTFSLLPYRATLIWLLKFEQNEYLWKNIETIVSYHLYIGMQHQYGNQYLAKSTCHVDNLIPRDEYLRRTFKRHETILLRHINGSKY